MIRINLLTRKKRIEQKDKAQVWLLVVFGVVLVEVVILVVVHGFMNEKLQVQERKNAELSSQIEQSKKAVANQADVKAKLDQLRAREDAIAKLQSARSGPTAILLELSHILTAGRGPAVDPARLGQLRRDDPGAAFSANWDTRRLWVTTFREEKRKLFLEGLARDGEDVSELARRMSLSDYFAAVKLLPGRRETDPQTKVEVVHFSVQAEVKY